MIIPNAYQTPNIYIDEIMQYLTDSEFRVLMFATRHILGWTQCIESRQNYISLNSFEHGFKEKMAGCGINRQTIIRAIQGLVEYGLLVKVGEPDPMKGQMWSIGTNPDIDGLIERHETNHSKRKLQTQKATSSRTQNEGGTLNVTGTLNDTGGGTLNVLGGGTLNVTHKKPVESHYKKTTSQSKKQQPKSLVPDGTQGDSLNYSPMGETDTEGVQEDSLTVKESSLVVEEDALVVEENLALKDENNITPVQAKKQTKAPAIDWLTVDASTLSVKDRLWNGVMQFGFGIEWRMEAKKRNQLLQKNGVGARIAKIVNFLQDMDAKPEQLKGFYDWYKKQYPDASNPRDLAKFGEQWLAYTAPSSKPKEVVKTQPIYMPEAVPLTPEQLEAALDKLNPSRKYKPKGIQLRERANSN